MCVGLVHLNAVREVQCGCGTVGHFPNFLLGSPYSPDRLDLGIINTNADAVGRFAVHRAVLDGLLGGLRDFIQDELCSFVAPIAQFVIAIPNAYQFLR